MSLRLANGHENARSALECGSLLPPWPGQLAGRMVALDRKAAASKLRCESGSKLPHSIYNGVDPVKQKLEDTSPLASRDPFSSTSLR